MKDPYIYWNGMDEMRHTATDAHLLMGSSGRVHVTRQFVWWVLSDPVDDSYPPDLEDNWANIPVYAIEAFARQWGINPDQHAEHVYRACLAAWMPLYPPSMFKPDVVLAT